MSGAVIAGIGLEFSDSTDVSPSRLATDAVVRAIADAGLRLGDIDGLLTNGRQPLRPGDSRPIGLSLQRDLELRDLHVLCEVQLLGASATAMVQWASLIVAEGSADAVVCVFADVPGPLAGESVWLPHSASVLDRYLTIFEAHARRQGSASKAREFVVERARSYASVNPDVAGRGQLKTGRLVGAPVVGRLRAVDCALATSGAAALVVTRDDRESPRPPVRVVGWAQRHGAAPAEPTPEWAAAGTRSVTDRALARAGIGRDEVRALQVSDPFSPSVLLAVEAAGFRAPDTAGEFLASGTAGHPGVVPVNTGGGQLAAFNLRDFTPLAEAVRQIRGCAGTSLSASPHNILVAAEGSAYEFQSALVLAGAAGGRGMQ